MSANKRPPLGPFLFFLGHLAGSAVIFVAIAAGAVGLSALFNYLSTVGTALPLNVLGIVKTLSAILLGADALMFVLLTLAGLLRLWRDLKGQGATHER